MPDIKKSNFKGFLYKDKIKEEPVTLLFGVYTGEEDKPNPLSSADVSVKITYVQTGESKEFTGKTNKDGSYIFNDQSFFKKSGEGDYRILLTFSKLGYKSKTVEESIEIRKLKINFDVNIIPKDMDKVMPPDKIAPQIVVYRTDSYEGEPYFLPKKEKATMNVDVRFNGDTSIQNIRSVFHPLMFWKAEDYAKDVVNGISTYNIEVEDGLLYTSAIYEYMYGSSQIDEEHLLYNYDKAEDFFNKRIVNYYVPLNTIFFDLIFKDGNGNFHKLTISTYPMANINGQRTHNILLPYSKEKLDPMEENIAEILKVSASISKKTVDYTFTGYFPPLRYMGYVKDLSSLTEFFAYSHKEKLAPSDFPDVVSSFIGIQWTLLGTANTILGLSLPLSIPSILLMPIINYEVTKICNKLVDLWNFEMKWIDYYTKRPLKDLNEISPSEDYSELQNIIDEEKESIYNTPYEIYAWDEEKQLIKNIEIPLIHWGPEIHLGASGMERHFIIANTGLKPLKININMMNLSNKNLLQEGGTIVSKSWWRSATIEPGCQEKFEYYKGYSSNPTTYADTYRNSYICDIIMDYNGVISHFSKNNMGICLKNISFYSKGNEIDAQKKLLFDKNDEIVFGADSWIPEWDRFSPRTENLILQ